MLIYDIKKLFIIGKCEIKNLQIFTSPGRYVLKPAIENNKYDINFNFNEIEIKINDCNKNQIKRIDKNNNPYCDTPICKSTCLVGITAKCLPISPLLDENDRMKNICECHPGWKGDDCDQKEFVDFR